MLEPTHVCLSDQASIKFHFLWDEIHKVVLPSQDAFEGKGTITSPKDGHSLIGEQTIVTHLTKL
jgi:hypothetical protein